MHTLTPSRVEGASRGRLLGRPQGALARLLSVTEAPVIGLAGTGPLDVTMELLADMLRCDGRQVARGMVEALGQAARLGPEDRIVVEITPALMQQVPHGLSTLVIAGLAPDELTPGQTIGQAVDGLRRVIAGAGEAVVVNADDAPALALAAEAQVEVLRVAAGDRGAAASLRAGELVVIDPLLGVERRVCRLAGSQAGRPLHRRALMLAAAVASAAGVPVEAIRAVAQAFEPATAQLEPLPTEDRRTWINDALATKPGRAAAALDSLEREDPILLIAGGRYGGQPLERWARAAIEQAETVLLFGSAADRLAEALQAAGGCQLVRCADLDDAVQSAARLARSRQRILFSPACEPEDLEGPPMADAFRDLVLRRVGRDDEQEAA